MLEIVLGTKQPNGVQACYLRTNPYNEIFICWYHQEKDSETPDQKVERVVLKAGYNSLLDFINLHKH